MLTTEYSRPIGRLRGILRSDGEPVGQETIVFGDKEWALLISMLELPVAQGRFRTNTKNV